MFKLGSVLFVILLMLTLVSYVMMHVYNIRENDSMEYFNNWSDGKCTLEQYRLELVKSDKKRTRKRAIYKILEFVSAGLGIMLVTINWMYGVVPEASFLVALCEVLLLVIYFKKFVMKDIHGHSERLAAIREKHYLKLEGYDKQIKSLK